MKLFDDIMLKFRGPAERRRDDDIRRSMNEFSRSLTLIVDLEQLKRNVISVISEIVRIDTMLLYLLDLDLNRFQLAEARGVEPLSRDQLYFAPDGLLVQWFTINETSLKVSDSPQVFSYFQPNEQQFIRDTGVDLIFPLLSMNRLSGLLCLGPEASVDKLSDGEFELLTALLGQASLAFENAYLYQQQRARLKRMYRADRLATLGQLAAGAAHEIRNPLTSIRSTIQYLHKSLANTKQGELLGEVIGEVDRINGIIEGLLSFSRPTTPEIKSIDLKLLLKQVVTLVETTARKNMIDIQLDYRSERTGLLADPSLLKQVFLNIVMNAFEAMGRDGELRITVQLISRGSKISVEPDSVFHLTFADTGPGIARQEIEHVFDPFYTTKKEGTGLGLSISYGIIQQHEGEIEIESITEKPGSSNHGTVVALKLPAGCD